jgi:hypothetical protein
VVLRKLGVHDTPGFLSARASRTGFTATAIVQLPLALRNGHASPAKLARFIS